METEIDEELALTRREQILLAFLAAEGDALDPVRIQKGLFILAQRVPQGWLPDDGRYDFRPYNYGPFSSQIYSDLEHLKELGYIEARDSSNASWKYHSASAKGRERAQSDAQLFSTPLLNYVARIREFVAQQPFSDLLKSIYREFPDYAVNSVFQY